MTNESKRQRHYLSNMDPRHLSRLHEEQLKAIDETRTRIDQCERFKSDYKALQEKLRTLPDTVKHDIMVPFGKFAFMPGQIVHTNEVLVLLGDNWFVERSAKQASEIVGRRIKELNTQIKDLWDQMKLLSPRLDFTTDLQAELQGGKDVQEIVEEYDEEKERLWDEQHKKNMKRYKEQQRQMSTVSVLDQRDRQSSIQQTDKELWSRLDELEKLEDERGDLLSSAEDSDDNDDASNSKEKLKPQVTWADEGSSREPVQHIMHSDDGGSPGDESDDEIDGSEDEEEVSSRPRRTITFTHTNTHSEKSALRESPADSLHITSPADIYKLYCPKPILKKKSSGHEKASPSMSEIEKSTADSSVSYDTHQRHPERLSDGGDSSGSQRSLGAAQQAFSGTIVERSVSEREENTSKGGSVKDEPPKRVSRFKAQRMQQTS